MVCRRPGGGLLVGGEATMDAMELLLSRESALKLEAPGPDRAALDAIFQSAVRAPDHGRLRPWRFVVIPEDRRAAFGEVMADCMRRNEPNASAEMLERERAKAMRAPIIVVAAAHVQKGHKIAEVEQLAAAVAATQNIMLAANAQGYGAMWKTGAPAYDATVKQALGLAPDDDIIGFIYLGKQVGGGIQTPRPAAAEYVSMWEG
jgi:nitroreductase